MTDFQALINKSIKNLRLSMGMSQEKFSEKCGLSTDNYRNLEYNRHSPKSGTIDKICLAFNLTPVELLRYGTEKTNNLQGVVDSLNGLTNNQLNMIKDFIGLVRNYKI